MMLGCTEQYIVCDLTAGWCQKPLHASAAALDPHHALPAPAGASPQIPPQFRKYYAGQQYDRLLQTVLLYFTAMFQLDWVVKAMERARKQHLEG